MSEWVGIAVIFAVGFLVGMWFGAIVTWHHHACASKKEDGET